jgi:hypothetical protein
MGAAGRDLQRKLRIRKARRLVEPQDGMSASVGFRLKEPSRATLALKANASAVP